MWEPAVCPKDAGAMQPIPGMTDAWKCTECGLEIWGGDVPSMQEYRQASKMVLQSASYKPYVSRGFVGLPPGARSSGSGGGRKRKKRRKKDLRNRYRTCV